MLGRHEIPTHLEVEDKVLWTLTARQLLIIAMCVALGYASYQRLNLIPLPFGTGLVVPLVVRVGLGILPGIAGFLMAFVRPDGRPFETWLMARARYQTLPKLCVWRRLASPTGNNEWKVEKVVVELDQWMIPNEDDGTNNMLVDSA